MRHKLILLGFLVAMSTTLFSQTKYNDYSVFSDNVQVDPWAGTAKVLVYLPADYKTHSYPVFWFWNGHGEDSGPVSQLAKWGPFAFVGKDWQPNFIVLAVQGLEWKNQETTDSVYARLKRRYNFGQIVASGLSAGGYGVTRLASFFPSASVTKDLVAIIPMSTSEGFGTTAVAPVIASGIGVWGFGDDPGDVHGINTHNFMNALQAKNSTAAYRWTNMKPRGHGGWNDYYNPKWKDVDGKSVYTWGLSFVRDNQEPPVVDPPVDTVPVVTRKLIATLRVYDNGDIEKE